MPHVSPLLKFTFKYASSGLKVPLIPVRFEKVDGTSTPIINAILDTGSDGIVIRQDLANWLNITLTPNKDPVFTAGGKLQSFSGIAHRFILGRGGREVIYENVEVKVIQDNPAFLIGITPIFEDFIVEVDGYNKEFTLTPRVQKK